MTETKALLILFMAILVISLFAAMAYFHQMGKPRRCRRCGYRGMRGEFRNKRCPSCDSIEL